MKHIGIIAEYNPFHNGHAYQIDQIKAQFPQKEIAVIMSGNYVQRGGPAIYNKYLRTELALACGVDLVLELPTLFSCASAEYFATASVLSFAETGIIDTLCFGAECDDTILYQIADILEEEPVSYKNRLRELIADGLSFPKARSLALAGYMNNPTIDEVIHKPNNILAIEYLKAIRHYHLPIRPYIIKRSLDNYHSREASQGICSATALRELIQKSDPFVSQYIPQAGYEIMKAHPYSKPIYLADFYPLLQQSILSGTDFSEYQDISEDFSNRLNAYSVLPYDIHDLLDALTHKNITHTRVRRGLIHILLRHRKTQMYHLKEKNYILYLRILGFRKESGLAKQLKTQCRVPVITKVASYKKQLSEEALALFYQQVQADDYYRQIYFNKYHELMPSEYEHSVIISE